MKSNFIFIYYLLTKVNFKLKSFLFLFFVNFLNGRYRVLGPQNPFAKKKKHTRKTQENQSMITNNACTLTRNTCLASY